MNTKKVIVSDLDGTLAESKASISSEMAGVLCRVLSKHYVAVVSGGAYSQFQKQFLSHLSCPAEQLKNLFLFPVNGSACYSYDGSEWKQLYNEPLTPYQKEKIMSAFARGMKGSGVDLSGAYGEIIEDRDSQITFSGKGQDAPLEIKKIWDPDGAKRQLIVDIIKKDIPEFEIRVNSASSIDITRKGVDKAYAIRKVKELLKVTDEDMIFVGDALYQGGNDSPVIKTGIDYIQETGPQETLEFLMQYI